MKASDDPLELEPVLEALPVGFDAAGRRARRRIPAGGSLQIGKQAQP